MSFLNVLKKIQNVDQMNHEFKYKDTRKTRTIPLLSNFQKCILIKHWFSSKMANLMKSAFTFCVVSVFLVSLSNSHPETRSDWVSAKPEITNEAGTGCKKGGDREVRGDYCGFGWRLYEWTEAEDSDPMGKVIWEFTKGLFYMAFMIICSPIIIIIGVSDSRG